MPLPSYNLNTSLHLQEPVDEELLQKQKMLTMIIHFFRDAIDPVETKMRSAGEFFRYTDVEDSEVQEAIDERDTAHVHEEMGDFVVMQIRFLLALYPSKDEDAILDILLQNQQTKRYISELSVSDIETSKEKFLGRYFFLSDKKLASHLVALDVESRRIIIESLYYWRKSLEIGREKIPSYHRENHFAIPGSIGQELVTYFYETISVIAKKRANTQEALCLGILLFAGSGEFQQALEQMYSDENSKEFIQLFFDPNNQISEGSYHLFFEYKKLFDASQISITEADLLFVQMQVISRVDGISLEIILNQIIQNPADASKKSTYIDLYQQIHSFSKNTKTTRQNLHGKLLRTLGNLPSPIYQTIAP